MVLVSGHSTWPAHTIETVQMKVTSIGLRSELAEFPSELNSPFFFDLSCLYVELQSIPPTPITSLNPTLSTLKDIMWQLMMTLLAFMTSLNISPGAVGAVVALS